MPRGCIQHPEGDVIVVHAWQYAFCDKNRTAAMLLSVFEQEHDARMAALSHVTALNQALKDNGHEPYVTRDEFLMQMFTLEDLVRRLMGLASKNTVASAILLLEQKGAIRIESNPNPRFKVDKTRYFVFCPEVLNRWIAENVAPPPAPTPDVPQSEVSPSVEPEKKPSPARPKAPRPDNGVDAEVQAFLDAHTVDGLLTEPIPQQIQNAVWSRCPHQFWLETYQSSIPDLIRLLLLLMKLSPQCYNFNSFMKVKDGHNYASSKYKMPWSELLKLVRKFGVERILKDVLLQGTSEGILIYQKDVPGTVSLFNWIIGCSLRKLTETSVSSVKPFTLDDSREMMNRYWVVYDGMADKLLKDGYTEQQIAVLRKTVVDLASKHGGILTLLLNEPWFFNQSVKNLQINMSTATCGREVA